MSDTRDGKWFDEWGACRVCDGEIPHGHTPNCDYWKLEQELAAERTAREAAEARLAEAMKDTARLDWLEGQIQFEGHVNVYTISDTFKKRKFRTFLDSSGIWGETKSGDTYRAAIDAAMKP